MKPYTDGSSYLPPLITVIAVIVFSTAGIARIVGWGPNSNDDSGGILALDQSAAVPATNEAPVKARCPECGVIVSMREIKVRDEDTGRPRTAGGAVAGSRIETRVDLTRSYEFTVRLADGSSRVFNDTNPARWRSGERVIVIDGANPSNK
jgi:outer membrane lipoprotein SlyB